MAGELRVYEACGISVDGGEPLADGSLEFPIHAVACNGEGDDRKFTIAAGATATIWAWASNADNFTALRVQGNGAFALKYVADTPTSASDYTPLGTHQKTTVEQLSCFASRWFQSPLAPTSVDAAWDITGRIYSISVKNTGTETITVRMLRVP